MSKYRAALLTVFMIATQSYGIIIEYGDFVGSEVMYLDVREDTRTSPNALFGAPSIFGNTLDFDPLSFAASVSSVTGTNESEIVDGQLNFTIMSNNDTVGLGNVIINEAGDYTLTGLGNAQATASVAAPVRWTITHVDGAPLSNPVSGADSLTFTPDAGTFALPEDVGTGVQWDGSLVVDLIGFAASNGIVGQVTKAEFALDNTLSVAASDGGSAAIFKKDFNGVVITIPEPAAASLTVLGVFAMIGIRRKRSQQTEQ